MWRIEAIKNEDYYKLSRLKEIAKQPFELLHSCKSKWWNKLTLDREINGLKNIKGLN